MVTAPFLDCNYRACVPEVGFAPTARTIQACSLFLWRTRTLDYRAALAGPLIWLASALPRIFTSACLSHFLT